VVINSNKVIKYNIVQVNHQLGQTMEEYQLCKTCMTMDWELMTASLPPCINCAVGKAFNKRIRKNTGGTTSDDVVC
jgi:hypothetical protein